MIKYQAVVFDLDGTLTDSAPGILAGARFALETMGRPVPEEAVLRRFLGPPLMDSFTRLCGMSHEDAARAQDIYREYYNHTGALQNAVYPGVRALLAGLRQAGVHLGVATHKPLAPTMKILKAFDLLRYFDLVAGPELWENPGPTKGELILRALPQGLRAVMIGDRATDLEGARQVGVDSIAALYGYGHPEEFAPFRSVGLAHSVRDLYGLLGLSEQAPRPCFISFEGNDGAGKSTQARLLAQRLRQNGHDVLLTRESGGTAVGEKIRDILLDRANNDMDDLTEALLYAAARAQHVRQVILPALKAGRMVISDRYVDSSLAYQGGGRGLGIPRVRQINAPAVEGCMPDLTVFLSLPPGEGIRRAVRSREADRLEAAGDAFHDRVAGAFRDLTAEDSRFIVVSSEGSKQETAELVYARVQERLTALGLP